MKKISLIAIILILIAGCAYTQEQTFTGVVDCIPHNEKGKVKQPDGSYMELADCAQGIKTKNNVYYGIITDGSTAANSELTKKISFFRTGDTITVTGRLEKITDPNWSHINEYRIVLTSIN